MPTWVRDRGLLLANLLLFVVFIGGMILTGVRVYNDEQAEHGGEPVSLAAIWDRRLRRGDLRELGERVPADGHVRPAHRLPVPARLVGVQADRRAGTAGRGPPRATRTTRMPPGRCARAAGCSRSYEHSPGRPVLPVLSSARSLLHAAGGAGRTARSSWRTAAQPVSACSSTSARPSSGSSRSRTGRASSWPSRPSWAPRSTCGSEAPPSRSRSPRPTPRPGPEQCRVGGCRPATWGRLGL